MFTLYHATCYIHSSHKYTQKLNHWLYYQILTDDTENIDHGVANSIPSYFSMFIFVFNGCFKRNVKSNFEALVFELLAETISLIQYL